MTLKLKNSKKNFIKLLKIIFFNGLLIAFTFLSFKLSYSSLKEIRYYESFKFIDKIDKKDKKIIENNSLNISNDQNLPNHYTKKDRILVFYNPIKNLNEKISKNKEYIKVFLNKKEEWIKIEKYSRSNKMIFDIYNLPKEKIQFKVDLIKEKI